MSNDYDWKVIDLLRHSLLIAEAERDDALWEIERIKGRAQIAMDDPSHMAACVGAIRDIRAMCLRALTPRTDGGRG